MGGVTIRVAEHVVSRHGSFKLRHRLLKPSRDLSFRRPPSANR